MAASAAAQALPSPEQSNTDDYRALVCLFFSGGQDSFNMLVPAGTEHAAYLTSRGGVHDDAANPGGLGLSKAELLTLPVGANPMLLGLHPSLTGVRDLFLQNKVALVANVGSLVDRTTKTQYNSSTAKLPRGLYSHSDQQQQWQTSVPTESRGIGWAGRAADLLHAGNTDARISMNLSLSGNNVWQSGSTLFPYTVSASSSSRTGTSPNFVYTHGGGSSTLSGYNAATLGDTNSTATRTAAVDNLVAQQYQNLFEKTFSGNIRDSIDNSAYYTAALSEVILTTKFPGETGYSTDPLYVPNTDPARSLSAQLKMVVRTIASRGDLGMKRQTFFINYGGWDHHDEVIDVQATMLDVVSRSLAAYYAALVEIGAENQATLYTTSDFGRTLTSNGNGSDHAWGGNQLVMGGAVNGGLVYGNYPDLALNGPSIVTSRGVAIPSLSVDEYFAELAMWFGVPAGSLSTVLPRIGSFYTPSSTHPVGFMKA